MFNGTRRLFRESIADEIAGKVSLNRLISLGTAGVLSFAFIKHALVGHPLSWDLMLGYSTAMAMAASPTLAARFLGLRYGNGNGHANGGTS